MERSGDRASLTRSELDGAGSCQLGIWSGKLFLCPNEMVPLQIDLAVDQGRYLWRPAANPADGREQHRARSRDRDSAV